MKSRAALLLASLLIAPMPQAQATETQAAPSMGEGVAAGTTGASAEDQAYEERLRDAVATTPDAAEPYARLGAYLLGHDRNDEAVANYQQAIMRDPQNPGLFVAIAVAYLHQGYYERAQRMAEEALRLDPGAANAERLLEYMATKEEAAAEAAHGGMVQGEAPH